MALIWRRLLFVAAAAAVAGCWGGVDAERRLGILDPDTEFDVAESYPIGAAVELSFTTVGLDGCYSAAGTEVDRLSRGFLLRPFDYRIVDPQVGCTDALRDLEHSAVLVFRSPGEHTVRIHGWDLDGDSLFVLTVPIIIE